MCSLKQTITCSTGKHTTDLHLAAFLLSSNCLSDDLEDHLADLDRLPHHPRQHWEAFQQYNKHPPMARDVEHVTSRMSSKD